MRKIVTTTFVSLDGVAQAPGGPEEDKSGGFAYGGWSFNYWDDMSGKVMGGFMDIPFELLLGRVTYDIFAGYWPVKEDAPPEIADKFNGARKYVVSHRDFKPGWKNTTCISGDVVAGIRKLKEANGPDLWVHGSVNLIQTLLKNKLIDRMHVWYCPLTLGKGKRLFAEGTQAQDFKLLETRTTTTGVTISTYEPAGEVKPGSFV
jgi:dihydrofolate reductase